MNLIEKNALLVPKEPPLWLELQALNPALHVKQDLLLRLMAIINAMHASQELMKSVELLVRSVLQELPLQLNMHLVLILARNVHMELLQNSLDQVNVLIVKLELLKLIELSAKCALLELFQNLKDSSNALLA
jgi:hypothetical protein